MHGEFAIAVFGVLRRMFQPVKGRFACKDCARGAERFQLARDQPEHWIAAQRIVIVQVFVAQRYAVHTLRQERFKVVLHQIRSATIREAGRNLPGAPADPLYRFAAPSVAARQSEPHRSTGAGTTNAAFIP